MLIGVVVLTWRDFDNTERCVLSLLSSDLLAQHGEVLIVDNHSDDNSYEKLAARFASVRGVHLTQTDADLGYAFGNNHGIRHWIERNRDIVIVLSNDCVVPKHFAAPILAALETDAGIGVLAVKVMYAEEPNRIWYAGGHISLVRAIGVHDRFRRIDDGSVERPRDVTFAPGCFFAVRAHVFALVGLLDESFFLYFEDVEFCRRVVARGSRIYYLPTVRILHKVGAGVNLMTYSATYLYYATRNRIRCFRSSSWHYRGYVACLTVAITTLKASALILAGRRRQAAAAIRGCLDGLGS